MDDVILPRFIFLCEEFLSSVDCTNLFYKLNFNAKVFILPWLRHLLFWRWGFREDLMLSIIVRQVIAFYGRRKLKLWPRSCWQCRRTSGSSRLIRRLRSWLPRLSKHSSSLKNTILFCSSSTAKALNCWGGTQWSMVRGLIWETWTLSPLRKGGWWSCSDYDDCLPIIATWTFCFLFDLLSLIKVIHILLGVVPFSLSFQVIYNHLRNFIA